jgi:magnesium transporter
MPLSFIAGLYGMNFSPGAPLWNLPVLSGYWGYPFALSLMGLVMLSVAVYFFSKGWHERRK